MRSPDPTDPDGTDRLEGPLIRILAIAAMAPFRAATPDRFDEVNDIGQISLQLLGSCHTYVRAITVRTSRKKSVLRRSEWAGFAVWGGGGGAGVTVGPRIPRREIAQSF